MSTNTPRWNYFAYGSNLNFEGMASRCGDAVPAGIATLDDWSLTFRGVADIERQWGRQTFGALWGISDRDLERLDTYEGYPRVYRRRLVSVRVGEREVGALTYVMDDDYVGLPSSFYYETIRQGYEQWDLPLAALAVAAARAQNRHQASDPAAAPRLNGTVLTKEALEDSWADILQRPPVKPPQSPDSE